MYMVNCPVCGRDTYFQSEDVELRCFYCCKPLDKNGIKTIDKRTDTETAVHQKEDSSS